MVDLRGLVDSRGQPLVFAEILAKLRSLDTHVEEGVHRVQIVIIDDVLGKQVDGSIAHNAQGEPHIMTDGAGLVSADLAAHVPRCTSGRVIDDGAVGFGMGPLLQQVRVWHRGLLAKGMLISDARLPPGLIVLTASMVKVYGRRGCRLDKDATKDERSAYEVIRTSNGASTGRVNPQMVPLLEYAGGPRMVTLLMHLYGLHAERLLELTSGSLTGNRLRSILSELGLSADGTGGVGPGEMLLAGFDPTVEPHLKKKVASMVTAQLEQLASGRFVIPSSLQLIGVPDFTGTLEAGTVCVIDQGRYCEEQLCIYRNPGTHVGDCRKVRGVLPPLELRDTMRAVRPELQNVIFFSTKGPRALADM